MAVEKKTAAKPKIERAVFNPEKSIQDAFRKIQEKPGVWVTPAGKLTNVYMNRRPTGIRSVDAALNGGYPYGGNVVITGPPNVGKDLLLNKAFAENQKLFGNNSNIAIVCLEGQWDKAYGRLCGVQVAYSEDELDDAGIEDKAERKRLREQLGRLDLIVADSAEGALDTVLELTKCGAYQYIAVNSVDGLVSESEAEGIEEEGIAGHSKGRGGQGRAMLLSATFRNQMALMGTPIEIDDGKKVHYHQRDTTFFWICQQRIAQLNRYQTGTDFSGGKAIRFYAALILDLERSHKDVTFTGPKDYKDLNHVVTSDLIQVHVAKGKYGVPDGARCNFRYYKRDHREGKTFIPAGTIDNSVGLRVEGITKGLIVREGRGFKVCFEDDPVFVHGARDQVDAWLRSNPDMSQRLAELLDKIPNPGEEPEGEQATEAEEKLDES